MDLRGLGAAAPSSREIGPPTRSSSVTWLRGHTSGPGKDWIGSSLAC